MGDNLSHKVASPEIIHINNKWFLHKYNFSVCIMFTCMHMISGLFIWYWITITQALSWRRLLSLRISAFLIAFSSLSRTGAPRECSLSVVASLSRSCLIIPVVTSWVVSQRCNLTEDLTASLALPLFLPNLHDASWALTPYIFPTFNEVIFYLYLFAICLF